MPLEHGAIYLSPDGRRFQAQLDKRQYGKYRSWTLLLVQTNTPNSHKDGTLARDILENMLFLDHGKIVRLDFGGVPIMVDTGWTAADLCREYGGISN
jgi:hypothetical protein